MKSRVCRMLDFDDVNLMLTSSAMICLMTGDEDTWRNGRFILRQICPFFFFFFFSSGGNAKFNVINTWTFIHFSAWHLSSFKKIPVKAVCNPAIATVTCSCVHKTKGTTLQMWNEAAESQSKSFFPTKFGLMSSRTSVSQSPHPPPPQHFEQMWRSSVRAFYKAFTKKLHCSPLSNTV